MTMRRTRLHFMPPRRRRPNRRASIANAGNCSWTLKRAQPLVPGFITGAPAAGDFGGFLPAVLSALGRGSEPPGGDKHSRPASARANQQNLRRRGSCGDRKPAKASLPFTADRVSLHPLRQRVAAWRPGAGVAAHRRGTVNPRLPHAPCTNGSSPARRKRGSTSRRFSAA